MLGHWFDILIIVFVGLLVFGPKRMIEMGSQLGKMVRELRESTRDLNFKICSRTTSRRSSLRTAYTASAAT